MVELSSGSLRIFGGFSGGETSPASRTVTDPALTIFDGTGDASPVLHVSGGYLYLDRLTITKGAGQGPGAKDGGWTVSKWGSRRK